MTPVDVEQVGPLLMALAQFGTKEAGEQLEKMFRALAAERDEWEKGHNYLRKENDRFRAENAALKAERDAYKAADKFSRDELVKTNKIWDDLAAENAALKARLHQIWWSDIQGDDCGGDGPEDRHTCSVRLCQTHLDEVQKLLGVEM